MLTLDVQTSIQDLVKSVMSECTLHFSEEGFCTDASLLDECLFRQILSSITDEFPNCVVDLSLLERTERATLIRKEKAEQLYDSTVCFYPHSLLHSSRIG
jgi:hypothetical protein